MIYYKKNSLIKKIYSKIKGGELIFPPIFVFLKQFLLIFLGFIGIVYILYLFFLPVFVSEKKVEDILNTYLAKETKLVLDIENLKIRPNYKFDINLSADNIKFKYSQNKDFLSFEKPCIDINLLTLFFGYIDLNKIQTKKITLSTNFTKAKHYSCFDYFDLDSFSFKMQNSKFKLRNIRILCDNFDFNLYDENIKKSFYINSKKIKFFLSEQDKPFIISAKGVARSSNHKIADFDLNLECILKQNALESLKNFVSKLNYNPFVYADKYKFYANSDIKLKINSDNNIVGSVNLSNYSFEIENIVLPKNNILILFKGDKIKADCNFNLVKDQFIKVNLLVSNAKNKFVELNIKSNEIDLGEFKEISDTFLKIFNPKLTTKNIIFSGTAYADLYLKSDYKTINSYGSLKIKNARVFDKALKLSLDNINSDINFANNKINILNASAYVDKSKFYLTGTIDDKTNLNLKVHSDVINIAQVMNLIKSLPITSKLINFEFNDYIFKKGLLKINALITGNLNAPVVDTKASLSDLKVFVKPYKVEVSIGDIIADVNKNILLSINNLSCLIDGYYLKIPQIKTGVLLNKNKLSLYDSYVFENNKKVINLSGSIDNFNTFSDFKLSFVEKTPIKDLIKGLTFEAIGGVIFNGKFDSPIINGSLNLHNVSYKDLNLYVKDILLNIKNSSVDVNIAQARMMDFDFNLVAQGKYINNSLFITGADFSSSYINLDNLEKYLSRITLPLIKLQAENIKGSIALMEAMGANLDSVNFEASLVDNILNVQKFSAQAFKGNISGKLAINLDDYKVQAELLLKGISVRHLSRQFKELSIATSGKLSALISVEFLGLDFNNIIKTLDGYVKFNIDDGELKQFAKLERFLQAGNILSQSFLKLTLNSTISAITQHNTGDFKTIEGTIKLKDSWANIQYIKTRGTNMSMYITGRVHLLTQHANIKVLGRIPSSIVNVLGNVGKFSTGQLVDKMQGDTKEVINALTASPFEKIMSTSLPSEDVSNIPPLANEVLGAITREFIVLISGPVQSASSIKLFKWHLKNQ